MGAQPDHHYACNLAEFLDLSLADDWTPSVGVLALLAPTDGGELDVEFRRFEGHPGDVLPGMPRREGCLAVALSVLGFVRPLDNPGGRRRRIRSTVAIDAAGDVSLLRYRNGRVERLHRVEGAMADLLYSMLDTTVAEIIPLRPELEAPPEALP